MGVPRPLRDDEIAAELAGVDVKRYRVLAGTLGSGMIGLAGALYAHSEGFISPSTFSFGEVDVLVIVMLAFGGIGSLLGPVVGAAAVHGPRGVDGLVQRVPTDHLRVGDPGAVPRAAARRRSHRAGAGRAATPPSRTPRGAVAPSPVDTLNPG